MTAPAPYVYYGKVLSVYDGDTFTIDLDLGIHVHLTPISCRFAGIDTPEIKSKTASEKEAATKARDWLRGKIQDKVVLVHSLSSPDKYGRLQVRIWCEETAGKTCINDQLISAGLARAYDGGTKSDWET